jgi:hypothetical protein
VVDVFYEHLLVHILRTTTPTYIPYYVVLPVAYLRDTRPVSYNKVNSKYK